MTTELYEVFSLEEGDEILISGMVYRIVDIQSLNGDSSSLLLVDENGDAKTLNALDTDRVRVLCDIDHNEYA